MTLADFTRPGLIVPRLRGPDAAGALQELSVLLQQQGAVADWLPFYQVALNREFLLGSDASTALAFPHARLPGVRRLCFAFGRCAPPIVWGPRHGRAVDGIFLLAVPTTDSREYFLLASGLVRLAGDATLVAELRTAPDAAALHRVWARVTVRQSPLPEALTAR